MFFYTGRLPSGGGLFRFFVRARGVIEEHHPRYQSVGIVVQNADLQAVFGMIEETDLEKIVRFLSLIFGVIEVEDTDRNTSAFVKPVDHGAHQSVIIAACRDKRNAETVMIFMELKHTAAQTAGLVLISDECQVYSINRSHTVKQCQWDK